MSIIFRLEAQCMPPLLIALIVFTLIVFNVSLTFELAFLSFYYTPYSIIHSRHILYSQRALVGFNPLGVKPICYIPAYVSLDNYRHWGY